MMCRAGYYKQYSTQLVCFDRHLQQSAITGASTADTAAASKTNTARSAGTTTFFPSGSGNSWPHDCHECQCSGVPDANRKAFNWGDDWPSRNRFSLSTLVGRRSTIQCGLLSRHVTNLRVRTV